MSFLSRAPSIARHLSGDVTHHGLTNTANTDTPIFTDLKRQIFLQHPTGIFSNETICVGIGVIGVGRVRLPRSVTSVNKQKCRTHPETSV